MLDFICMGPVDLPGARRKRQNTKWKISLSTVGLEPTTLRFKVWCSTDWASRAWRCIEREKVDFKSREVNCLKECALALNSFEDIDIECIVEVYKTTSSKLDVPSYITRTFGVSVRVLSRVNYVKYKFDRPGVRQKFNPSETYDQRSLLLPISK